MAAARRCGSQSNIAELGEVGSIASALLSLFSSIVGGVLVLAGQYFAHRAEGRRQWLLKLHDAAADLATSYLQEVALVNDSRRAGKAEKDIATTTYVVDRQKALGRFQTLPWASAFEHERRSMGAAIQKLWLAWDASDDEFRRAHDDTRSAVAAFTSSVGHHLLEGSRRRPRAPERTA
jgi:hypothetical protein